MQDAERGDGDDADADGDGENEDENDDNDEDDDGEDGLDDTPTRARPRNQNRQAHHAWSPLHNRRGHDKRDSDSRRLDVATNIIFEPRGAAPATPAGYKPAIRFEALGAATYDIVPTIAAPHSTSINAVTATPDMRWVFSGGSDGWVRKFNWIDTANGKSMLTVAQRHPFVDSVTKAGVLMSYWENEDILGLRSYISFRTRQLIKHRQVRWWRRRTFPFPSLLPRRSPSSTLASLRHGVRPNKPHVRSPRGGQAHHQPTKTYISSVSHGTIR